MLWSQTFAGLVAGPLSIREAEDVFHELCAAIDGMDDAGAIEQTLLGAAGWITRGGEARWVDEEGGRGAAVDGGPAGARRASCWEFPARRGDGRRRLLVVPGPDTPPSAYQRLRTLCVVADAALARSRAGCACRFTGPDAEGAGAGLGPIGLTPDCGESWQEEPASECPLQVQDGTFLKAVLPFAVSQARRHQEPLCLVCLAIDRLAGLRELLGEGTVERLAGRVGAKIVGIVRASDVVCRMEDNRFLIILPRACLPSGLAVARKICRAVEDAPELFPELGGLTVSAGVAEFPASAPSVYSLIDEADAAMERAQARGRNTAVAADGAYCPGALAC
ncbi:Diguanylate cyclase DosC [Aquisphaera giovannonii]|uniref:diguanylate cyclase n=1 Tax=Aquisphaera giovannonii TaxID=406548 RepID=A0A5B9WDI1_9BACT|nr:GGDEF domain-containing protein [Aquisphaera giovannonii]QEH38523.1 Diguanylate cyclase DosC [Aquisphaera giovannonii]